MPPKITNITFSEFEIRVCVLIEFSRDSQGKIIGVRDIAFPTEEEMKDQVEKMIPASQKGEDFDLTSATAECPKFVVDPSLESFLNSWNEKWKETLVGDFLCEVCKDVGICFPELAKLHDGNRKELSNGEKKKEETVPKKQKPFKIALE